MTIADFSHEQKYATQGYTCVVGIDEAGRGPLAGPVVAAAAVCRDIGAADEQWDLVRDSKTLSEKQRGDAFALVEERFVVGTGICSHETIDRMNILQATFLAMKKAFSDLERKLRTENDAFTKKPLLLLDGAQTIESLSQWQTAVPQGDKKVKSIAAASIVAKVTRDQMMTEFDAQFPEYGFSGHKGYGTKAHMDALKAHGACPIHRKSFAPVRAVL